MAIMKRSLLVLLSTASLFADGFIIFPPPVLTPLSVRFHKVTCEIDNGVALTTIDQEFINDQTDAFTGGRYVFPIPKGAAIEQFKVVVNGEEKVATVMSRDSARVFFSEAVKNSNQASLLEYMENSAYSVEVGSVAPGSSRRIRISYVEVLPKTNGLTKYLYPLNTEKYSMRLIDTVSIFVKVRNSTPITSVYSPSYPVSIERADEYCATVTYLSLKSRPDRDFDLYYKLSEDEISFHLFPFKKEGEDGYFLMLITPKLKKPQEGEKVVAKDIVFTIDHSGSMAGAKIAQARDALRFCVDRLMPEDYFNIVAFDNQIISNANELLPASSTNVREALTFVETITEGGSTDIAKALTTSLGRIGSADRPHYCIFLTDGLPTAGVTDIGQISALVNEANKANTRIFSVGFGFDVNTVLIDKISIDNSGYALYCNPDQNIEEVIGDLYRRIEAPVMISPELVIADNIATWGISPAKLQDLFSGSEIAVYGRYKEAGSCAVTLSGNTGRGIETLHYDTDFPAVSDAYPFVPRLWATQRIAALMTKIKLQTLTRESIDALIDSVKALSLQYGIVTPYTSAIFVQGSGGSWAADLQTEKGAYANTASNYMQGMQQNSNTAQTVVSDTNALPLYVAPRINQMQNAANKIFIYTSDSIWADAAYDSTAPADTIYYGSDEYFALASQSEELRQILSVGNRAAFNYAGKNYVVYDRGAVKVAPTLRARKSYPADDAIFSIKQTGGTIVFSLMRGMASGRIDIYSVKGRMVANVKIEAASGVNQTLKQGIVLSRGTYLAVFRNGSHMTLRRFVVR